MNISRPRTDDAPSWYPYFFNLVPGDDLISALINNKRKMLELINSVPLSAENFRYATDKWTIKQVFIHLVDEERYYTYKAFCYSRRIDVNLEVPKGDAYSSDFNASKRTLKDIGEEFSAVREATLSLFKNMTMDMLDFKDFPGKEIYSARSLGWFTVGHNIHHCSMIEKEYLGDWPKFMLH